MMGKDGECCRRIVVMMGTGWQKCELRDTDYIDIDSSERHQSRLKLCMLQGVLQQHHYPKGRAGTCVLWKGYSIYQFCKVPQ